MRRVGAPKRPSLPLSATARHTIVVWVLGSDITHLLGLHRWGIRSPTHLTGECVLTPPALRPVTGLLASVRPQTAYFACVFTRLSWVGGSGEGQGGSTALESWQNGVMGAVGRTPHDRHRPVRRCFDAGSVSARLEAREEDQVVGYGRGPDVGLEVVKAAPGATRQAVGALQA